jgi:hypothetical protein
VPLIVYFAILGWGVLGALLVVAFTSSWPEDQHKNPSRAQNPTEDELSKPSAIASVLHRLVENKKTDSEKREIFENSQHRWSKWTAFGVWIYTLITVGIFIASLVSNSISGASRVDANRAWLAPTTFFFEKSVDDPNGPIVKVDFQNVGRVPALDVNVTGGIVPEHLTQPLMGRNNLPAINPSWEAVEADMRKACEGREPIKDRWTIFPSVQTDTNITVGVDEIAGSAAERGNVVAGTAIYIVVGCIVYRTFDETRRTGFCRYITKHRTGEWEILNCPVGNFAY